MKQETVSQEAAVQVRDLGCLAQNPWLSCLHSCHIPAHWISEDGNAESSSLPSHSIGPALAGGCNPPGLRVYPFAEQLWWFPVDVTSSSLNAPTKTH